MSLLPLLLSLPCKQLGPVGVVTTVQVTLSNVQVYATVSPAGLAAALEDRNPAFHFGG